MAILDHLVPAFSGNASGKESYLVSLPRNVWLKAPFLPYHLSDKGVPYQRMYVYDRTDVDGVLTATPRAARPDDFRYRVIEDRGRLVVEVAQVDKMKPERPELSVGYRSSHDDSHRYRHSLAPMRYKALASTATVDPTRWVERDSEVEFRRGMTGGLLKLFVVYPALFIGGLYGVSQLVNRATSSRRV